MADTNELMEECRKRSHLLRPAETVARTPLGNVWRRGWDCEQCDTFHDTERNPIRRFLWWLLNGDAFWEGEVHYHGGAHQ